MGYLMVGVPRVPAVPEAGALDLGVARPARVARSLGAL